MAPLTLVGSRRKPPPLSAPIRLADVDQCDIEHFDSGEPLINDWLRDRARAAEGRTARTYVILAPGYEVVAFYSISAGSLPRTAIKRAHGLPDPLPVIVLGRLGVTLAYRRRGIAKGLIRHAMQRCLATSETTGVFGLIVQPLDSGLRDFYAGLDFVDLRGDTGSRLMPPMFMRIETIREAFAGS